MSLPEVNSEGAAMPETGPWVDRFGRVHTYLRVSVTDRCNYRCTYCMPKEGLSWMPRDHLLSFEEVVRVARVAVQRLGLRRIRLTGGEPTIRRGLVGLIGQLSELGLDDLAMTTNGHRFADLAQPLAQAGLNRINVSLDTVDEELFRQITRGGDVQRVLKAIEAAIHHGMTPVKINCVVVGGLNDHLILNLVEFFRGWPEVELRFIEYMPFSANEQKSQHVPSARLREIISERYPLVPLERPAVSGPATHYQTEQGHQVLGFISPMSEHFCDSCNRLRLQADGHLRTCLSMEALPSLRDLIRAGLSDDALEVVLRSRVWGKIAGHEAHEGTDFEGNMTAVGG